MKHSLLVAALLGALASPALAGQQAVELYIPGMSACPSCPYIIKSVLSGVEGVSEVETVYETGIATVFYDDEKASPDDMRKALFDYGYRPRVVSPEG